MIAFEFLQLMELPILIEIVTRPQCTNPQDRFSPVESPASPGNRHAVIDQMPTGPFNHP
jgi:hypothetical protein